MNIKELKISDKEKIAIKELQTPKTIAEVAAILDISYTTAFTKLAVWLAKGWIKKIKLGRGAKYHLNIDEIDID